ncbi:glycoside hydrolase [Halarcobacter mediterraneus]|uniref:Glycoside hydrolase n=1 Tax=Halarcobacter mediterraneus TaxID=2023153 RepID=A0A4Q1B3P8_9BACT|nr:1,4-alpha-glucan branching protein domain-containing protein [Halarcobacter mediterraneus]RXK13445.1 glycoside hydrolase [Halarcobacter mediterraneus]
MLKGYWTPVLHSHLPFVKHPDYDNFLEEHWLFEAITECYIPLLQRLKKLEDENIDFRLTTSVTPPLAEMLDDRHLMEKYEKYLIKQLELAQKEVERTKNDENFKEISLFYQNMFLETKEFFDGFLNKNVLNGYRYFYNSGKVEVITCGATHGFLPILSVNEKAVRTQIEVAVKAHEKHFGRKPKGIWLPECAYYEGLDKILKEKGIKFFIVDSHALTFGKPTSLNGVFAPTYTPSSVAAFGRDGESSKQVWSSKEGYPGDFSYRDFYRDIGYDLDFDYIKPYINPDGVRVFTGFKYHKITGTSNYKEVYEPFVAKQKTIGHAENFHHNREKQFEHLSSLMDRTPLIVSPYDAELFGHWWFEGPEFLYNLFKQIDEHKVIKAITPIEYLNMYPKNQMQEPNPSSWGDQGYYDVWLNEGNAWIYRHLHNMADVMEERASEYFNVSDFNTTRVLNQMLRELLLAQSSDWAFLMTTATATEYSVNRTKEHISNFNELLGMIDDYNIDIDRLEYLEYKNSIFNFIDFRIFITS